MGCFPCSFRRLENLRRGVFQRCHGRYRNQQSETDSRLGPLWKSEHCPAPVSWSLRTKLTIHLSEFTGSWNQPDTYPQSQYLMANSGNATPCFIYWLAARLDHHLTGVLYPGLKGCSARSTYPGYPGNGNHTRYQCWGD